MAAQPPVHVVSVAITPKIVGDQALIHALFQLRTEDPAIRVTSADPATGRAIVAGVGELHLEIILDRLRREFGIEAAVDRPRVFLKAALRETAVGECKHLTTLSGIREYAHVKVRLTPRPDGTGYLFENRLTGGAIPTQFFPAVIQGIDAARGLGVYPIEDVMVELVDGSHHELDSSESAFRSAASQAFIYGAIKAKPAVVEPIMRVEIAVPEEFVQAVMADLARRRGQVQSSERMKDRQIVVARIAVAHLFGFASGLNHDSRGQATYSMRFDGYQERDSFSDEGDRDSLVAAPRKPIVPGGASSIALPEPDADDYPDEDWLQPRS